MDTPTSEPGISWSAGALSRFSQSGLRCYLGYGRTQITLIDSLHWTDTLISFTLGLLRILLRSWFPRSECLRSLCSVPRTS